MNLTTTRPDTPAPTHDGTGWVLASANTKPVNIVASRPSVDVRTGVRIDLPAGHVALVVADPDLATEHGVGIAGGIMLIGPGHGEIVVPLKATTATIQIRPGQPIARLVDVATSETGRATKAEAKSASKKAAT